MENKRRQGSHYESLAAAHLVSEGMTILERNFRSRMGEIDLIAKDGETICFVEVKGRRDDVFGDPSEAVNAAKQMVIRRTAQWYLMKNRLPEDTPCRFDVVSICGSEVRLIRDAF